MPTSSRRLPQVQPNANTRPHPPPSPVSADSHSTHGYSYDASPAPPYEHPPGQRPPQPRPGQLPSDSRGVVFQSPPQAGYVHAGATSLSPVPQATLSPTTRSSRLPFFEAALARVRGEPTPVIDATSPITETHPLPAYIPPSDPNHPNLSIGLARFNTVRFAETPSRFSHGGQSRSPSPGYDDEASHLEGHYGYDESVAAQQALLSSEGGQGLHDDGKVYVEDSTMRWEDRGTEKGMLDDWGNGDLSEKYNGHETGMCIL